jgi:hypothetical protein
MKFPRTTARIALLSAIGLGLSACTSSLKDPYPQRYPTALAASASDTVATIPSDAAARFAAFFEAVHEENVQSRVESLYAANAYFSDTLFLAQDREALVAHFERLQRSQARIDVEIDDQVVSGSDLYLRWRMTFTFEIGGREKTSTTIGMTQLRFDRDGHIRFHQDFWDSAQGFYQHVPVLGAAIRSVAGRMATQ